MTEDDKGKKMESIKVFAGAILYLKSHFLKTLAQRMYAIDISDISWVLTVPAIWNDSSKLFATEAAKEVFIMHYTNTCMYITINMETLLTRTGVELSNYDICTQSQCKYGQ